MGINWSMNHYRVIKLFIFFFALFVAGCATAHSNTDDRSISVISIKQGVESNFKEHPDAKFCGDFNMTINDVKRYFQLAKAITDNERHYQFSWSPCFVTVSIKKGEIESQWKLFASGVAKEIGEKHNALGCKECGIPFFDF